MGALLPFHPFGANIKHVEVSFGSLSVFFGFISGVEQSENFWFD